MTTRHVIAVVFSTAALMAAVGLSGCFNTAGEQGKGTARISPVELTEREKTIAGLSGDMIAVMELSFPEDADGRRLYLEEWVDGRKASSDILMEGEGAESMTCYISSDIDKREDGTWSGTSWKMILECDGSMVTTGDIRTGFPPGKNANMAQTGIYGQSGIRKREPAGEMDKHKTDAQKGEYVLAARCFQFDKNSMETVDCEEMARDDEVFQKYSYVVLVRLVAGD